MVRRAIPSLKLRMVDEMVFICWDTLQRQYIRYTAANSVNPQCPSLMATPKKPKPYKDEIFLYDTPDTQTNEHKERFSDITIFEIPVLVYHKMHVGLQYFFIYLQQVYLQNMFTVICTL
jgi:hypothetical protein